MTTRGATSGGWLACLRLYVGLIPAMHLVWEVLQLPLYTIWTTDTIHEIAFAVIHCTAGDLIIAVCCLVAALLVAGEGDWPWRRFGSIAILAVAAGIAYTGFSEWLNVEVRKSWAYSEWMPIISILDARIGVSPLLQWLVVPSAALVIVRARTSAQDRQSPPP